jgi:hypothetical protein
VATRSCYTALVGRKRGELHIKPLAEPLADVRELPLRVPGDELEERDEGDRQRWNDQEPLGILAREEAIEVRDRADGLQPGKTKTPTG